MDNSYVPIVKIQLDTMSHQIRHAMLLHSNEINEIVQEQVDKLCTLDHLTYIIRETAQTEMDKVIKDEIRKFYAYGEGREVVKKVILETLSNKVKEDAELGD